MADRTYVPGMDNAYARPGQQQSNGGTSGTSNTPKGGTYVPGLGTKNVSSASPEGARSKDDGAPVLGFLYSISRHGITEYWPLRVGANTIGRDASNDIVLLEESVSGSHAVIHTRMMKNGKVIAQIQDVGSKNGIFVNDEELGYTAVECHNNDVIQIGEAYKLLLILVNSNECGIGVAQNFRDVESAPEDNIDIFKDPFVNSGSQNRGTVPLSGDSTIAPPVGTRFMPDPNPDPKYK